MNETSFKLLLIGLPETGKTTFLAALWHAVYKVKGELRLKELPVQSKYIDDIWLKWVDCKPLGRTIQGPMQFVEMKVVHLEARETIELIFPDLSGETFEKGHFEDRQWSKEYDRLVSGAAGIILFIHPDKVYDKDLIVNADRLAEGLQATNDADLELDKVEISWSFDKVPTQVKIVDLLQLHLKHLKNGELSRVVVVISAWDRIPKKSEIPKEWLEARLPLLHQYLHANQDWIDSEVFGVSAQGGDIEEDRDNLLRMRDASLRIIVREKDGKDANICTPITWVLRKIKPHGT